MKNLLDLRPVYVVGIGLHRYQPPSDTNYVTLGLAAVREALADAGIGWPAVRSAYVGTVLIGMAAGPAMLRYLGATGLSITQVENASASGSTAFRQAVMEVAAGFSDVALAMGVDKPGPASSGPAKAAVRGLVDDRVAPFTHFALLTQLYLDQHGASPEQIATVAVKNHRNGALNPYAQRQQAQSLDQVMEGPPVSGVLTRLQCTPIGEGAAAVIVMSDEGLERHGVDRSRAIQVVASAARSEEPSGTLNFDVALTQRTVRDAYAQSGVQPSEIDIVELHDAFTIEELLYTEAMGLSSPGAAVRDLEAGAFDIGGRVAISPSGGLIAMGHPIGPTGVGQVAEITRQLRGEAGARQHAGARTGLAHMVGVGPVCVVHILRRPG